MSHDDFEQRALKRRRLSNESSISGIEGRRRRHNPYGCSSIETWGTPASVANSVSIQYERFENSSEVPIELHDISSNWQYQCTSLHASALPQPWARNTEVSLPSYLVNHEHLLFRDAQPNKSPPAISNTQIVSASPPDVVVISGEEVMPVCFGMVSQISIADVLYRLLLVRLRICMPRYNLTSQIPSLAAHPWAFYRPTN